VTAALLASLAGPPLQNPLPSLELQPTESRPASSFLDSFRDGTPDFLRLDDRTDREVFRRRFTLLAEGQYFRERTAVPIEISDCAALVRFAYREALRDPTADPGVPLPYLPAAISKYRYPFTPLGAGLFRIREGKFEPEDLHNRAFAEFADANTLRLHNMHLVGRDLRLAQPGDLLFYRQLDQRSPFHVMIYVGLSPYSRDQEYWIVYHTGPVGKSKGEIRRTSVLDLLRHPQQRWRPISGNSSFLGVYRWNILREGGR